MSEQLVESEHVKRAMFEFSYDSKESMIYHYSVIEMRPP